ncbi:MAG: hypothetical protein EXX96DRAFT_551752 [Benjaminiella poitrasii]|nr:MAG: hypothetical protein EXX96DRAFT_551752 [Benjaminiella poitrasii]
MIAFLPFIFYLTGYTANMHRRIPYSGKKKRQQLKEKNAKKIEKANLADSSSFDYLGKAKKNIPSLSENFVSESASKENVVNAKSHDGDNDRTKLVSVFEKLTSQQIEKERLRSMKPLQRLSKDCLEIKTNEFDEYIDFPKRPAWDYNMTKEEIDQQEQESFDTWVKDIEEKHRGEELSWFERNLEVWRQLWRVLEISDIILIVMDIRNPMLHFPRSLYEYVTNVLKRPIIGIFNKADLVSEFTVFAWKKYFEEKFPNLRIATFSCYPRNPSLIDDTATYALKKQAKRPKERYYHAQGVQNILSVCRDVIHKPDVSVDWKSLIAQYSENNPDLNVNDTDNNEDDDSDTGSMMGLDDEFSTILDIASREIHPHKDYITLGLVGHPNVGKSSLINSIMRKTVVSTSRTPGHTKHFQTIHISDNVRLCDSPGLVFPALIPRALQILSGMYPIAQVQEPYSSIRYLAERIPLEKVLSLTPPLDLYGLNTSDDFDDLDEIQEFQWSALSICEAFAEQRGFHIAKAAGPDVYRAANNILRLTADGRILLSFKPPGFFSSTKYEKLKVQEVDKKELEDNSSASEEQGFERQNLLLITRGGFSALLSDPEDDN